MQSYTCLKTRPLHAVICLYTLYDEYVFLGMFVCDVCIHHDSRVRAHKLSLRISKQVDIESERVCDPHTYTHMEILQRHIHTYIDTYIHTYIHTCIHTDLVTSGTVWPSLMYEQFERSIVRRKEAPMCVCM